MDEWAVTSDDGMRLVVRRDGTGRPLVLVHPSAGGLDSYAPVVPHLAGRQLWTYARRAYAPSGDGPRPATFADDAADLQAVLAAVGEPADVLGASYGATVALHAARADASRLRSLILFEPPLFAAGPGLDDVLTRYRDLLADDDLAAAARLFAAEVARVPAAVFEALAGADDEPADRGEAVGCLHDLEAMAADTTDLDRWSAVRTPTLLLQGTETWSPVSATVDALAGVLPHATRATLAGQSHFATHTAPALFADAVATFLATREA